MTISELKTLRDQLQQVVGHINAILPHLHQLTLDIGGIERLFDSIDISLLPPEAWKTPELKQELNQKIEQPFNMVAFLEFVKQKGEPK